MKDKGEKDVISNGTQPTAPNWALILFLNSIVVVAGVIISQLFIGAPSQRPGLHYAYYSLAPPPQDLTTTQSSAAALLGPKGAYLFKTLDTSGDGLLSVKEFGPVVERLTGEAPPCESAEHQDGEKLTLYTSFEQIVFESMKTFEDEGREGMMRHYKNMKGIREWADAAMEQQTFSAGEFRDFLPKIGNGFVGNTWYLFKPEIEPWAVGDSNKYYPPNPSTSPEAMLFKLLKMLHPRPFLVTRFGPQGAVAALQASSDRYYKISFRIHAEFQTNESPQLPFWYTPAQFTGHIIISKDGTSVRYLRMYLPKDRKLNIDMEWITKLGNKETNDPETMEVEIAYQPKMEISTPGEKPDDIAWTESISDEEAKSLIEKVFYPFKKVQNIDLNWRSGRTLREGPLESSPIMSLLNQHFASSWILLHDLQSKINDTSITEELRQKYNLTLDSYSFPVECLVQWPNGTVIHHENLNFILFPEDYEKAQDDFSKDRKNTLEFENMANFRYAQFLTRGLSKAGVQYNMAIEH